MKIKIELTENEITNILNSIQVRALSGNIDDEDKKLGNKLIKALNKMRSKSKDKQSWWYPMQNEFDFKTHYQDNSISKSKDKDKYPYKAGHRGVRSSIVSAEDIDKRISRLHKQVIIELAKVFPKGLTTSELADKTERNLLTIRPRTTELKLQGLIIDTEKDRKNENGKPEIIYKLRGLEILREFNIDIKGKNKKQKTFNVYRR